MLDKITLSALILFAIDWLVRIGFILYIPRKRKPSSAIAWLLLIFLLPGLGIVLFLFIGSAKLSRYRRQQQLIVNETIEHAAKDFDNEFSELSDEQKQRYIPITTLCQSMSKLPARSGNSITVLPEYNEAIADLVIQINKATEFIHLEYFIVTIDQTTKALFRALEEAVQRGVKVRMLFDAIGQRLYPYHKQTKRELTRIGVEWHKTLPIRIGHNRYNRPDLRNHRKIVVIDDHTAYIGSQNLIDRTYHRKDPIYYDELSVRMSGPIVRQCAAVFASDWFFETNEKLLKMTDPATRPLPTKTGSVLAQILPSGPNYETEVNARLFTELIHIAKTRIVITNPYFVPNEAILTAVTSATRKGVEVIIINSEAMDQWTVGHAQRSFYQELLEANVKIYLYKYPVLLHSKHMTIDDDIAVIGSSNMDIRSFELDLECNLITYDKNVVNALRKVQLDNLSHSKQLDLETWKQRGFWNELGDSLARLTSSLQ